MSIEFRDPPPKKSQSGYGRWMTDLLPVMERPGEWACVDTRLSPSAAAVAASNFRRGIIRHPPGKWEFRSYELEVFARYIGPE